MAGLLKEITELPTANTTTVSDYLHIKQGTTDRKITWSDLIKGHGDRTDNPHNVTATQLNLGNVTNDEQLKKASNLADVPNKTTARGNLSVYSIAQVDTQHNSHANLTNNPHGVTKSQVGLGNVTNDLQLKRASNLNDLASKAQARVNLDVYSKAEVTSSVNTHANLTNNPHGVTKSQVGLGNVTNDLQLKRASNLSDLLNVSSARTNLSVYSIAEVNSQHNSHANLTNNPHGVTKSQVGLGNLNNYGTATTPTDGATNKYVRADALNSLYNQVIDAIVPIGGIIMYNGSIGSIPSNFKLCDGTNGTPDLRGRFPICSGGVYDLGDTGGATQHKHGTTVGNTALTVAQLPAHTHGGFAEAGFDNEGQSNPKRLTFDDGAPFNGSTRDMSTGDGQPHGHTTNEPNANHLPPYYAVPFIMRVS